MSRHNVVHIMFKVEFSGVYVFFIILDYGIEFSIRLPYALNKLNLLNWLTKGLFRLVLKWFGKPDGISLWELWLFPPHKGLEVEVSNVDTLTAISYQWMVHSDHWGHRANVAVAGMELSAQFYDSRHWDYDTNAPEVHNDEEEEK